MNLRPHLSSIAAACAILSGATAALGSLLHAAAVALDRGAQSLHIVSIPLVPAAEQTLLQLRAEAYAAGGVLLTICLLLVTYLTAPRPSA